MSTASMTFGRPTRIAIPRGSILMANLAFALINLTRRIDRWQLARRENEPKTTDEVLDLARRVEQSDPGFAADLRAAVLRSTADQDQ